MFTILSILMGGILLSSLAFSLVYFGFPWRTTAVGRALMTLSVSLSAASATAMIMSMVGRVKLVESVAIWVLFLAYIGVNASLWTQLYQLLKVRHQVRQADAALKTMAADPGDLTP